MRPLPARLLFIALSAAALILGVLTRQVIFFVVAVMALLLLGTSLSTARVPLTRALGRFAGQAVDVRLWGAPPPGSAGALVVESVNLLSVGVHVFFKTTSGQVMHLKIAQPSGATLADGHVVIATAKYVQWNGAKIKSQPGAPAISIAPAPGNLSR